MAYHGNCIERLEELVLAADAGEPVDVKSNALDDHRTLLDVVGARRGCVA
jgi:hypothetical protein